MVYKNFKNFLKIVAYFVIWQKIFLIVLFNTLLHIFFAFLVPYRFSGSFKKKGLTLTEVLIVLAIFIFISASGFFLSLDSFRSQYFLSEEKMFLNLLKVARNRALLNENQTEHGVFISDESFILFQGKNFDLSSNTNEFFPRSSVIDIQSDLSELVMVFENLSGRAISPGEFFLSDGLRNEVVKINLEGQIN